MGRLLNVGQFNHTNRKGDSTTCDSCFFRLKSCDSVIIISFSFLDHCRDYRYRTARAKNRPLKNENASCVEEQVLNDLSDISVLENNHRL
jgi:hypothetical protein